MPLSLDFYNYETKAFCIFFFATALNQKIIATNHYWGGFIMKLTGAEIIVEVLIEQGVTDIFGYPGGTAINIYEALYHRQDRIHHYLTMSF